MSYEDTHSYTNEKPQSMVLGHERRSSENDGGFRPSFKQKFRVPLAKQIITQILNERLERAIYDKDQAPLWAREIAEEIKFKLLGKSVFVRHESHHFGYVAY
ncbi:15217_t:CDS:2 [Acaulospora morrowiae]|uniref:15217_t:CDS:1 n=1 Tax=Acaulospora morrowiae TaxID=94023 RepID=A0A9N8WR98_9GLOM|nr:15217_t:CDS:2 [Acaulospora morrowiae]